MKNVLFRLEKVNAADGEPDLDSLYSEKRKRVAAFSRKDAIAASVLGDHLARALAAELVRCDPDTLVIEDGKYGKPVLRNGAAEISIAHSGTYAAAAAALRPVGIDLERHRPLTNAVLYRLCTPEELAWVRREPSLTLPRFFRLWTMKEAYGKMLGLGIFTSRRFAARFSGDTLLELYPDCLFLLPDAPEGYSLSLCVTRES